uniref:HD2 n=1 Tax=Glomus macrocarpum TaxID=144533 RepID=A0A410HFH0_9GLOM|nr:HD2 [Glomus macrocarpum]
MDNLKNKTIFLEYIESQILIITKSFNNQTNSSFTCFNSFFRTELFKKYNLYCFDESTFINLFSTYSTESFKDYDTSNIIFDLERLCFGHENIKKTTLKYLTEMRIIIEQKCYEHRNTLLKSFFTLPSGDVEYIKNILIEIIRSYENLLYQITIECYNSIKILFKDFVVHISRFSDDVSNVLEAYFNENKRPDKCKKELIAKQTGLSEKQVEIWFNNRRSRTEKDDTDYEKLTTDFLEKKFDWSEKFAEIDSGSLTSKDMIQTIVHEFNLRRPEEEETNQASQANDDMISSETVEVLVSRPTRSRANAIRRSISPYSKDRSNNSENTTIVIEPENPIIRRNHKKRGLRDHFLAAKNVAVPYTKSRNKITSFIKDQTMFSEISRFNQFSLEIEPSQTLSLNENETQFSSSNSTPNTLNPDLTPQYFDTGSIQYNHIYANFS